MRCCPGIHREAPESSACMLNTHGMQMKALQTALQARTLNTACLQQPSTCTHRDVPLHYPITYVCIHSPPTATGTAIATVRVFDAAAPSAVLFAISSAMQSSGSLRCRHCADSTYSHSRVAFLRRCQEHTGTPEHTRAQHGRDINRHILFTYVKHGMKSTLYVSASIRGHAGPSKERCVCISCSGSQRPPTSGWLRQQAGSNGQALAARSAYYGVTSHKG